MISIDLASHSKDFSAFVFHRMNLKMLCGTVSSEYTISKRFSWASFVKNKALSLMDVGLKFVDFVQQRLATIDCLSSSSDFSYELELRCDLKICS